MKTSVVIGPAKNRESIPTSELLFAYQEAADHLDLCAAESDDDNERRAMREVARRIRKSMERVANRRSARLLAAKRRRQARRH